MTLQSAIHIGVPVALCDVSARGWLGERIERASVAVDNLYASLWWTGAHGWGYEHPARWVRNAALLAQYTGCAHPGIIEVSEQLLQFITAGKTAVDYARHQIAVYNHEELLMGLLACYRFTGDARLLMAARDIGCTIADQHPVNKHYYKQLAIGRLLELAEATSDASFVTAATAIADDLGLEMLDLHAHGAAAAMIGVWFAQLSAATDDAHYLDWAWRIWQAMRERMMVTGGIGEILAFSTSPGESDLHDETCQSAWWMLLNLALWRATGETSYLDLAERILLNHLLFQQLHRGEDAGFTAMNDIDQGFRGVHNYICCDNEGCYGLLELLTHVFTVDGDRRTLSANFILPAEMSVTWPDGSIVRVRQESAYPVRGEAHLCVATQAPVAFTLRVRIPDWTQLVGVYLNGRPVAHAVDGTYIVLARTWEDGDEVIAVFPLPLRAEADISGAGADACRISLDGVEQEAKRVAIFHGPVVAAIFRVGHGNDVSWVWTGDYPEVLDTGGCATMDYPASKSDYLTRDGSTQHTGHTMPRTEVWSDGLPTLRWTAMLDDVEVTHTVTVLPGLPVTLLHREEIRGWDGRGDLLCAGLRFAVRKSKKNLRYRAHVYQRAYPDPMVTTRSDISDIALEEYGCGTFSRYERLEDGSELAKTGTLRLDNGYFRAVCLYDPAPVSAVVCRRTDEWAGVYLRPAPATHIVLTRRLVFPLAARPLCQTMVRQMTERAEQTQAMLDGDTLTLTGQLTIGVPACIPRLPDLHAGMVLHDAVGAARLYDFDAAHFIADVTVPGAYRVTE